MIALDDPRHGSRAGYQAHRRAGEDACPACLAGRNREDKTLRYDHHRGVQLLYTAEETYAVVEPWLALGLTFGGVGTEEGKFKTPHGIWLDDRPGRKPHLVVADRANARLQRFTLDGEHIGEDFHEVSYPASFDTRGDVLLVPDLHARVTLLDRNDKLISHLGYDPAWTKQVLADRNKMRTQPERWEDGKFVHPHDACFDHDGNILVAEWVATGRLVKLRRLS